MYSTLLIGLLLFFAIEVNAQELNVKLADKVMMCESGGNVYARNDNDKKITGYSSFGLFQFQPSTFLKSGIRYRVFPEWFTITDAMRYIYRPEYQGAIAHGLMADNEWFHWKNCVLKIARAAL